MKQPATSIKVAGKGSDYEHGFRTAVSLHAHTRHSKESLGFIPKYAVRVPVISSFFRRERNRYFRSNGKSLDFSRGYWTPPVSAQAVYISETKRIESELGLDALVSMTDHDDIATANSLKTSHLFQGLPISLEWTVPFEESVLHLGIHNLPPRTLSEIMSGLSSYALQPQEGMLEELLAWIGEYPDTLVVLNHPFSDLRSIGPQRIRQLAFDFLNRHKHVIHALEMNGYRSWMENRNAISLAETFRLPVVSGGDRHGCAPNAVLNLTNAKTFSEFVSEIRKDKVSYVLVMPEYRDNLFTRFLESLADFFREYPENPLGFQKWTDRVFLQLEDGLVRPLSYYWQRTVPTWVKSAMLVFRLMVSKRIRPALRMAFSKKEKLSL